MSSLCAASISAAEGGEPKTLCESRSYKKYSGVAAADVVIWLLSYCLFSNAGMRRCWRGERVISCGRVGC